VPPGFELRPDSQGWLVDRWRPGHQTVFFYFHLCITVHRKGVEQLSQSLQNCCTKCLAALKEKLKFSKRSKARDP
jgi:hypothetical protein